MKILFLTGREVRYPLNQMLLHALRQHNQVDVIQENSNRKPIIMRSVQVFVNAIPHLINHHYDLIFVSFFGQFLAPAIRAVTITPILFHPLISTYETLIFDRKVASYKSLTASLAFFLDYAACHAANHMILDTRANASYFSTLLKIPENRLSVVFVGTDERIFYPRPTRDNPGGRHIIHYHGSFLPLHGIDTIIEAACLLKDTPDIQFQLLGSGIEYQRINQLVQDYALTNVHFVPAVPLEQLPEHIAKASICLGGHFGTSEKAARVIAGKTFQNIAMGKATIVGENPANHELLEHGYDAWFCPMNNPQALADGIVELINNASLRNMLGQNARNTFMEKASLKVLSPQVQHITEQTVSKKD